MQFVVNFVWFTEDSAFADHFARLEIIFTNCGSESELKTARRASC